MPAEVVLESAGDHAFDLGHLRREGAEEVVRLWLQEAGFDDHRWRMRVEKKITCNAETRPVYAVNYKPWCCYLKVKPGDNDSAHYCSLLVPDGMRGEAVFEALKRVEEGLDRNWRNGIKGAVQAADGTRVGAPDRDRLVADAGPTAPEPSGPDEDGSADAAPEAGGASGLHDWRKDADKLRLTLLAVHELWQAESALSQNQFVEALASRLGWQGANRRQIGGVLRSLVRRGQIEPVLQGKRRRGYALTDQGRRCIQDLLPADPPAPTAAAVEPTITVDLLNKLKGLTRELDDHWQRLEVNRARRAELVAEIERLDAEALELNQLVTDPEALTLIHRLVQVRGRTAPPQE